MTTRTPTPIGARATRALDIEQAFGLGSGENRTDVRTDVPADSLAVSFIGLYVPPAILWNVTGGRFDITGQVRRAWQVFRDGVRPVPVPVSRPRPRARVARRRRSHS